VCDGQVLLLLVLLLLMWLLDCSTILASDGFPSLDGRQRCAGALCVDVCICALATLAMFDARSESIMER